MENDPTDHFVRVRGAGEHNLKGVDVDIPRNAMVAFTGISGSGKSSLAFGTLYAEAQRRYFESVAPYARRLLHQLPAPHVQEITGLPPAVALQQRRGAPQVRSTVGTITTLSNLLRMLYSRVGTYPPGAARLEAEAFSPNTAVGACPWCHGLGVVHDVTEELLVPNRTLSIREGAIAAWPGAWQGANLRSIVTGLGIDVDKPWRKLKKADRDWLLYTDEQPSVLIKPERDRVDYGYHGTFWSARRHIMHVLADSKSQQMRDRALRFVRSVPCPECDGSGLGPDALAVTFAGCSIAQVNAKPLVEVAALLRPTAELSEPAATTTSAESGERTEVAARICADLVGRLEVLLALGLGYLSSRCRWRSPQVNVVVVDRIAVNSGDLIRGELRVAEAGHVLLQLSHTAGPNEDRSHSGVTQCPGDCHLREGLASPLSDVVQASDTAKVFLVEHVSAERATRGGPGAWRDAIEVAVSEKPLRQNREGDAPDSFGLQDVEEAAFDPAIEHRVRRLVDEQRSAQIVEDGNCFGGSLV